MHIKIPIPGARLTVTEGQFDPGIGGWSNEEHSWFRLGKKAYAYSDYRDGSVLVLRRMPENDDIDNARLSVMSMRAKTQFPIPGFPWQGPEPDWEPPLAIGQWFTFHHTDSKSYLCVSLFDPHRKNEIDPDLIRFPRLCLVMASYDKAICPKTRHQNFICYDDARFERQEMDV